MNESTKDDWAFYLLGAFSALMLKWFSWVWQGWEMGKTTKESTKEWFSVSLRSEQVSWLTTIGVVWVLGSVYINRIVFLWDWVAAVPVVKSISFLLGTLVEYIAPAVTKWILGKMPSAFQGGEGL